MDDDAIEFLEANKLVGSILLNNKCSRCWFSNPINYVLLSSNDIFNKSEV